MTQKVLFQALKLHHACRLTNTAKIAAIIVPSAKRRDKCSSGTNALEIWMDDCTKLATKQLMTKDGSELVMFLSASLVMPPSMTSTRIT